jgi:hypothetical protein
MCAGRFRLKSREVVLSSCGSQLTIRPFHRPYPVRETDNLRIARNPSSIDAKRGDQFLQADLLVLILGIMLVLSCRG